MLESIGLKEKQSRREKWKIYTKKKTKRLIGRSREHHSEVKDIGLGLELGLE